MIIAALCILRDARGLTQVSLTDDYELNFTCLKEGQNPNQKKVLESWNALANSDLQDAKTFEHVKIILQNTRPKEQNSSALATLNLDSIEQVKPKATAANPRAFKGTKRKLPKAPSLKALDLRPYLVNPTGIEQLIALSKPLQESFPHGSDPACLDFLNFPCEFRLSFLFLLSDQPQTFIKPFLKLYFDLDLDKTDSLRKLSLKLLHKTNAVDALNFLQTLLLVETTSREAILKATIDCDDYTKTLVKIASRLSETLMLALEFEKHSNLEAVWQHALNGLKNGAQPELIRFDLELHRDFSKLLSGKDTFETVYLKKTPNPLCCLDEIRALLTHYAMMQESSERKYKFAYDHGVTLAMYCAKSSENEKTFLKIPWNKLDPKIASRLIYLIGFDTLSNSSIIEVASFLAEHGNNSISCSLLNEISQFDFHTEIKLKNTPEFVSWFLKIAALENASDAYLSEIFYCLFSGFPPGLKSRLLQIPDTNWQELIKACFRSNDANLIHIALRNFQRVLPEFLILSLEKTPRSLMKTLKTMGCLNRHLSEVILNRFANSLIYQMQSSENVLEQRRILKTIIENSCTLAINRKVRDAITREIDLPKELLSRTFEEVKLNMERIKLEHLEKMFLEAMSNREISEVQNKVRHAFKILHQNNKEQHARAFKKFLNHYLNGQTDYLIKHQRNQNWLKKNNSINFDPWLNGFQRRFHVGEDKTAYTLKIELDPLEELKHGTYAGTCTGIGGKYSWSALGTVLDINKRVVYAFDDQNRICCRQIIAISKKRELVLLAVYPEDTPKEVKRLFAQYSTQLAELMGVKIVEEYADYEIELILTCDWWDDFQYIEESEETDEESSSTV